ncbi:MAG TPA: hypothetical protein VKP66_19080 [Steroidobacteraceae bacterium]|nr:hypothetical protein [Steroidobacteraceae bacterium]
MTTFNRGPMKGKTISYASSERMEEFRRIADDFMLEIFDFLPGDYLITDESSLRDFTEMGSSETSPIWSRIAKLYAIGQADVPSERLVDIFAEIRARGNLQ